MGEQRLIVWEPGKAELNPAGFDRFRRRSERIVAVLFPLSILLLLQVGAMRGWWDRRFTPAPTDVATRLVNLFREKDFATDVWVTTKRVGLGYGIGVMAGVSAGLFLGLNRILRKSVEPTFNAMYTVPKISLLSPFLIIFGFNEKPIIFLIATTVFFFVWLQTQTAVLAVHPNFTEAAAMFQAKKLDTLRHVILPAALPQMFTAFRIAANVSILSVIGIEVAFSPQNRGVGYVINYARMTLDADIAWAGILVASCMGVLSAAILRRLARLLIPWAGND